MSGEPNPEIVNASSHATLGMMGHAWLAAAAVTDGRANLIHASVTMT